MCTLFYYAHIIKYNIYTTLVSSRVDNSNEKLLHPPGTSFAPLRRHTGGPQVSTSRGDGLGRGQQATGGTIIRWTGHEADTFSSTFAETPFFYK